MRILIVLSVLFCCSPAMAADYAKWGMSAAQIVAASKGEARLPTRADKDIPLSPLKTIAIANDSLAGVPVKILFLEHGGRFTGIDFAPASPKNCGAFLAAIERIHGPKTLDKSKTGLTDPELAWFWKLKSGEILVLEKDRIAPFPTGRDCVANLSEKRRWR